MIPEELFYSKSHEWVRVEGNVMIVGITHHAQDQLGDVVHISFPSTGESFGQDESFGEIESVKAVSDIYAPVEGEITEINSDLEDDPSLVNSDPYEEGWLVKIAVQNDSTDHLMSADEYREYVESEV